LFIHKQAAESFGGVPNLNLVAGQDLKSQIDAYEKANLHGKRMDQTSRHALEEYTRGYAKEHGLVFQNKVAIVIVSVQDVVEEHHGKPSSPPADLTTGYLGDNSSSRLILSAVQVALACTGHAHMILVTLGMSLCEAVVAKVRDQMISEAEWESFQLLSIPEFEGYSSAINQAVSLAPSDSIITVFTPSFTGSYGMGSPLVDHHHNNHNMTEAECHGQGECLRDDDVFLRYEGVREVGGPVLVTIPPLRDQMDEDAFDEGGCWASTSLPLLIFDDKTYQSLGPLDEVGSGRFM